MTRSLAGPLCAAALALCARSNSAQLFQDASGQIPATQSYTEDCDFADVDHDGDWDVALADGGDQGNDQSRLWVNRAGLQGGALGLYADVTATQLPVASYQSRDIDFADIDGDSDADLVLSNDSGFTNQSSRFWINAGGLQGGAAGVFTDQTAARWIGLGAAGSSLPAGQVLASGGFIDWCSDSDLADLDLDGDLDLVHSSHGGAWGGQTPTRVFSNDGLGNFSEFNPSSFQLPGSSIANSDPGLWCEGLQLANTLVANGSQCDVATSAEGIELGDLDGDFDVDLLHGARQEAPRLFSNRWEENGGALGFRDMTGTAFPAGYWSGTDNWEQEQADFDLDADLDFAGVNWPGSAEAYFPNQASAGAPSFGAFALLPDSNNGDNDATVLDYDNDGDPDLFVSATATTDRLYRNLAPAAGFALHTNLQTGFILGTHTLEAEAADVEHDGDWDLLSCEDAGHNEILYRNTKNTVSPQAPRITDLEALANSAPSTGQRLVRAHVYDNAPNWGVPLEAAALRVQISGCTLPDFAARGAAVNLFRGTLPANLIGALSYALRVTDEHGNTAQSSSASYTSAPPPGYATPFGLASPGSLGNVILQPLSVAFPGTTLYLGIANAAPSKAWLGYLTTAPIPGGLYLPGLGALNIAGAILLAKSGVTDASGCAVLATPVPAGAPSGLHVFAQGFVVDGLGGDLLASTLGLELVLP